MSAGPICTAPPLTGGVAAETSGPSAPKEANLGKRQTREAVVYSNVDKSSSSFTLAKDTESRAFFPVSKQR